MLITFKSPAYADITMFDPSGQSVEMRAICLFG